MMNKSVICDKPTDKRRKWGIFEELHERNEILDEAICILSDLKELIRQLPDKLATRQTDVLLESVVNLDSFLDDCIETTGVYFEEIDMQLDEMQKSLLHDESGKMHNFSKLVSEVKCSQKRIDTLIGNAEEEIYKFLEFQGLNLNRRKTDIRIMQLVLNS